MLDPVTATREALGAHCVTGCKVCVGLSGGLDSVVLLQVMTTLAKSCALEVSAVHVNHGLQARAPQWAGFCHDLCARLGVPLSIEKVTVSRDSGIGIEAAARAQRYAVFAKVKSDYLALAHHLDDQVETFLLQLLRGAGAKGLSAMPVERAFVADGPRLLRPFLALSRTELAQFAAAHALKWIEDESNAELVFDRNFLRHSVLPVIGQRFPAYRTTLSRASLNLAEVAELADILGQQDLEKVRIGDGVKLDLVRTWPTSRVLNVLRWLFRALGYSAPRRTLLTEALRQSFAARQDARVRVDFGDFSLRRYRGNLFVVKNLDVPSGWQCAWNREGKSVLPQGLGELRFERTTGSGLSHRALQGYEVRIAFRSGGEYIALAGNRPHRDLRKLYQEAGIAPWVRERTPLLFCGSQLAFVPGLGVAAEFQAEPGDDSWQIEWVRT